jgi:SP family sugar:H+ symporter-like MFS transporter
VSSLPSTGVAIDSLESPRWLVLQGKNELALTALNRLRPAREVASGMTAYEVQAFEQAIEEDKLLQSGSWFDLLRGNYLRRTMVSATLRTPIQV